MITQLVYWSLVGWCGTVPKKFPIPIPDPDPWPWWYNTIAGAVGGIAVGLLVQNGLGMESLVATSFGAFAGGRIISEVGGSMRSKG